MLKRIFKIAMMVSILVVTSSVQAGPGDIFDNLNIYIPKHKDVMTSIGEPNRADLNPDSIRVLVWNMYKGQNETWKKNYEFLAHNRDILMLQEMYLDEKMKDTFEADVDHEYHTATSFIYREGNIRTGVATAGKVAPSSIFYQQSKIREPGINTPKMALFALYPVAGSEKDLMTINIHAINFVSTTGLARQIKDIEEVMRKHDGPIIFAGDFNTWSKGKQRFIRLMASRHDLIEVKFKNDTRMRTFGNVIDYVFYRGLTLKKERVWGELNGADHKAMEVVFTLED